MRHVLSKQGEKIVLTLIRKVRVASFQQIANGWFSGCETKAKSELKSLIEFGFLGEVEELVGPRLPVEAPLFAWTPSEPTELNFEALAYKCRNRWQGEATKQTLFFATREAVNSLVGFTKGRMPPAMAIGHDLQVTEIYINMLIRNDQRWKRWQGEDQLLFDGYLKGRQAIPDAIIRSRKNRFDDIVMEIGGQYDSKRLEEFHADYQAYCYEIW